MENLKCKVEGRRPKVILSIAGSDNTGGAGIQADIKTCCYFGHHAATVITAVTAQNCHGVNDILYVGDKSLQAQLETFFECYQPDAVKVGMIPTPSAVKIIVESLLKHKVPHIVVDPVISATRGGALNRIEKCDDEPLSTLEVACRSLYPIADIITPNLPELFSLAEVNNIHSDSEADALHIADSLLAGGIAGAILIKGGHSSDPSLTTDILVSGSYPADSSSLQSGFNPNCGSNAVRTHLHFTAPRIDTPHSHGTGCILSTAIACGLAEGLTLPDAIKRAKAFISSALINGREHPITDIYGPAQLAGL